MPKLLEVAGLGPEVARHAPASVGEDPPRAARPIAGDDDVSDEELQRRLVEGM